MKKILALVLTLAMMLTMLNVGFVVSAADEKPAGAIAIDTAEELAAMEAGNYYYLTADITVGTPRTYVEIDDGEGNLVPDRNEVDVPNVEADVITIPAGVTLDGNGYTIYSGNYITNPGMYNETTPYTSSLDWTHEMFVFTAGAKITLKNLKFGDETLPIHLNARGILSGTSDWSIPMFADVAESVVEWNNVVFTVARTAGTWGLKSMNTSAVMAKVQGAHTFTNCTLTGPEGAGLSAGAQGGAWFYNTASGSSLTMTNCVNDLYTFTGSYVAGFVHTPNGAVTMINCVNNADITGSYNGTAGFVSGFVGNAGGTVYMDGCVNNGNLNWRGGADNSLTIGGAIVGRTNGNCSSFDVLNCVNNGALSAKGKGIASGNHGFGGIVGHVQGTHFLVDNCINYGDIAATACAGGIVGRVDGGDDAVVSNCKNFGDITKGTTNIQQVGGIVGQTNTVTTIENCVNYGNLNAGSTVAGILAGSFNNGDDVTITGCANYGSVYGSTYSAGIVATSATNYSQTLTVTITDTVNYGTITTGHSAGGFVAQVWDKTTVNISNSLNVGTIGNHGVNEGIGGFIGRVAATVAVVTIADSANIGTINGSSKNTTYGAFGDTFGQLIGLYTVNQGSWNYAGNELVGGFHDWTADGAVKPVLTNCYAYGTSVVATGAMSLTGWITRDEATLEALATNQTSMIPVDAAPNGGAYGINVEVVGTVETLAGTPVEDAIDDINAMFDIEVMAGAAGEDAIVVATPELRGYQMSLDGNAIRIAAVVSSINYDAVGFTYSVTVNGNATVTDASATCNYVLEALNATVVSEATTDDEQITESISAADLAGKYIAAITFANVPAEGTVVITVAPTADTYTGAGYTITLVDGVVTSCVAA